MRVRVMADPGRVGVLTSKTRERGGRVLRQIVFPDGTTFMAEDQIESLPDISDPIELIEMGKFGRASDLRRNLTHIRLSGRLANLIYSMDTTNTDFYPYQFKPVLKFLNTPNNGLLIADEVGLGKTIEAGLIWTELRSRFDYRRLMVLCPAMLREKWKFELYNKFGIETQVLNAEETLAVLKKSASEGPYANFSVIGSLQGLRPPKGWRRRSEEDRDNTRRVLAEFIDGLAAEEPLVDFLVIEEAHYMRNPETASADLGRLLRRVAENVVLLSATPVHLKSQDLYQLLNLVDEDTFNQPAVFDAVLEANAPLIKMRELILSEKMDPKQFTEMLREAIKHPFLNNNRQMLELLKNPPTLEQLRDPRERSQLAYKFETINLLGHVVARTRKREVTEWRVVREVVPESIPLNEVERSFYNAVTDLVRGYCARYQKHEGFLLVMPQRQIVSSMPAALQAWQSRNDSIGGEAYESADSNGDDDGEPGPIVREIVSKAFELANLAELEENDSKFERLKRIVADYLKSYPDEKIVLFSYFRPTLSYLSRRLTAEGIENIVLMGGLDQDKNAILSRFSAPDGPNVLLSSEVGSEGIDLQFARVLINYDLPWNPMRVEQRIGRIDRLGQKSPKILIWNLFAEDTIDARIYKYLFERLKIFEYALGGLESVLGDEIRKLTIDLLGGRLTPEQEEERIKDTAMALANIKQQEEHLEEESAHLVAYGDYILNQVRAAKELNRYVSGADLWAYVRDFFFEHYAGSEFRQLRSDALVFDVRLSGEAKNALDGYLRSNKLPFSTRLAQSAPGAVRCRFENKVGGDTQGREEVISQFHPLVRFVSKEVKEREEAYYPAVSLYLNRLVAQRLSPGDYVFSVQRWAVMGLQDREVIYFAAVDAVSGNILGTEEAEYLITTAAMEGSDWLEARYIIDLSRAAELTNHCLSNSEREYEAYVKQLVNENNDRADLQERTLARHLANQLEKLEAVKEGHMEHGRDSLVKATEARMVALQERVKRKQIAINERRELKHRKDDVCVGVIRITA